MSTSPAPWYTIENESEIPSPALIVYADRAEQNIERMIRWAGGTDRLRPHVKTHKMAEIVRLQMAKGIRKFKCATIAEAEMIASCGAADVLLAFPQVGPNVARLVTLVQRFPHTHFSTIADDAFLIRHISTAMAQAQAKIDVLLDIDNGMHRSGIAPLPAAVELYRLLTELPGVVAGGLHVYDGHVRDQDINVRRVNVLKSWECVDEMIAQLRSSGWPVPRIVAGGTPSFPIHATFTDRECSPGTSVFWDVSYRTKFPELDFEPAALLLVRVISKPGGNRLCLDLGYKAVSPDNPWPRVEFFAFPDAKLINHSEEHLAIETEFAARYRVGDVAYGIPYHVCPTCALHREAVVVRNGRAVERWKVLARDRQLTI